MLLIALKLPREFETPYNFASVINCFLNLFCLGKGLFESIFSEPNAILIVNI
jgi:hypothetical protein